MYKLINFLNMRTIKFIISIFSVYRLFMTKNLLIFIICIMIDYIRHCLFNLFKIRKICIILEKNIFEILK